MASESVVDQIVKSLSFEVEAVPQLQDVPVTTSATNMTPMNVKIKVRKKHESEMEKGVLEVPKFGNPDGAPERIRLISSDQTIMSFNVLMEGEFAKKGKRKPRKFFSGCLGTQYDDDDGPYVPSSTYNAKIADTGISSKSEGVIKQNITLLKHQQRDSSTEPVPIYTRHSILGKCKPGGCLDPPFGEDRYSYKPVEKDNNLKIIIPESKIKNTSNKKSESCKSKLFKATDEVNKEVDSILHFYETDNKKDSIDTQYSDSIITYPPEEPTSQKMQDKFLRTRISCDEKQRKSISEGSEIFYSRKLSKEASSITDVDKDSNVSKHQKIKITREGKEGLADEIHDTDMPQHYIKKKLRAKAVDQNVLEEVKDKRAKDTLKLRTSDDFRDNIDDQLPGMYRFLDEVANKADSKLKPSEAAIAVTAATATSVPLSYLAASKKTGKDVTNIKSNESYTSYAEDVVDNLKKYKPFDKAISLPLPLQSQNTKDENIQKINMITNAPGYSSSEEDKVSDDSKGLKTSSSGLMIKKLKGYEERTPTKKDLLQKSKASGPLSPTRVEDTKNRTMTTDLNDDKYFDLREKEKRTPLKYASKKGSGELLLDSENQLMIDIRPKGYEITEPHYNEEVGMRSRSMRPVSTDSKGNIMEPDIYDNETRGINDTGFQIKLPIDTEHFSKTKGMPADAREDIWKKQLFQASDSYESDNMIVRKTSDDKLHKNEILRKEFTDAEDNFTHPQYKKTYSNYQSEKESGIGSISPSRQQAVLQNKQMYPDFQDQPQAYNYERAIQKGRGTISPNSQQELIQKKQMDPYFQANLEEASSPNAFDTIDESMGIRKGTEDLFNKVTETYDGSVKQAHLNEYLRSKQIHTDDKMTKSDNQGVTPLERLGHVGQPLKDELRTNFDTDDIDHLFHTASRTKLDTDNSSQSYQNALRSKFNTDDSDRPFEDALQTNFDTDDSARTCQNALRSKLDINDSGRPFEDALQTKFDTDDSGQTFQNALRSKFNTDDSDRPFEGALRTKFDTDGSGRPFEDALLTKIDTDDSGRTLKNTLRSKFNKDDSGRIFEDELRTKSATDDRGQTFQNALPSKFDTDDSGRPLGDALRTKFDTDGSDRIFQNSLRSKFDADDSGRPYEDALRTKFDTDDSGLTFQNALRSNLGTDDSGPFKDELQTNLDTEDSGQTFQNELRSKLNTDDSDRPFEDALQTKFNIDDSGQTFKNALRNKIDADESNSSPSQYETGKRFKSTQQPKGENIDSRNNDSYKRYSIITTSNIPSTLSINKLKDSASDMSKSLTDIRYNESSKSSMSSTNKSYEKLQADGTKDYENMTRSFSKKVTGATDRQEQQNPVKKKHVGEKIRDSYGSLKSSLIKNDSITVNFGFQSYENDKKERIFETIDISKEPLRKRDDTITYIRAQVKPQINDLRIPIDPEHEVSIQIRRNRSPLRVQIDDREHVEGDPSTRNLEKLDNKRTDREMQEVLNSIYEHDLIPLQKAFKYLKQDVDMLTGQQSKFKGKAIGPRRSKTIRIVKINPPCCCWNKC